MVIYVTYGEDLQMTKIIEINPNRILYLLKLFNIERDELLTLLNEKRRRKLLEVDIFNSHIKISHLKKIDKIFSKGLSFYTDPSDLNATESSSIFLRKKNFHSEIGLSDKQLIRNIDEQFTELTTLSALAGYSMERKIDTYSIDVSPQKVASKIRKKLDLNSQKKDRIFLKNFIDKLSNYNILVLEFIESEKKKHKTNIEGCFISPNIIAIKRLSRSFKREIFTLAHELGHYLLEKEELNSNILENPQKETKLERWCNNFAFHFLVGDEARILNNIKTNDISVHNEYIRRISKSTHVSRLAIFVHLAQKNIITWRNFSTFKEELEKEYKNLQEERRNKFQDDKKSREKFSNPIPIYSPLEINIYRLAYFEGVIDEYRILSHFKNTNKHKDIDKFLYE